MLCAALCHGLYQDFAESSWLLYDLQAKQIPPPKLSVGYSRAHLCIRAVLIGPTFIHVALIVLSQSSVNAAVGNQSEPLVCL